jgi:hypothetical protein
VSGPGWDGDRAELERRRAAVPAGTRVVFTIRGERCTGVVVERRPPGLPARVAVRLDSTSAVVHPHLVDDDVRPAA